MERHNTVREPPDIVGHAAMQPCRPCSHEAHQFHASLCWKVSGEWVDKIWLTFGEHLSLGWDSHKSLKKDKTEKGRVWDFTWIVQEKVA